MDLIRGGFSVRRVLLLAGLAFVALAAAGPPNASAVFSQCPAVGQNTGCHILITINADGSVTITADTVAPNDGPYDGAEDTLVGLQNNSASSISSLNISSATLAIFGFDGDGICDPGSWPGGAGNGAPAACPSTAGFGPTGYEGPNNTFSNISVDEMSGTVNFTTPIPPGGSTYWGLEEELSAADFTAQPGVTPPTPPATPAAAAAPAAAKKTCKKGSKLKGGKCVKEKKKKKKKKVKPTFTG